MLNCKKLSWFCLAAHKWSLYAMALVCVHLHLSLTRLGNRVSYTIRAIQNQTDAVGLCHHDSMP